MKGLTAIAASVLIIAACSQGSDGKSDKTISEHASTTEPTAIAAASTAVAAEPLGKAVSGERAKKIMYDRHEDMEKIGRATRAISRELDKSAPNLAAIRASAATVAELASKVAPMFPPGTGPNVADTRAKAEIWQKPADFAAKMRAFNQAAKAFNAAARTSNVDAIKASAGRLSKTCRACHDPYRTPEHD